ncbi:SGNH/GDSL hydrolase family protein [Nocardioides cynanchi]|uniref:SGNH/GDSL hydrolase family protein n=1 Tax=Nocardioides cynanchi TaxID=2558918 RepID=UPI0012493B30|nr:SGNH/GDSL hydrolase family protein [Nocardioides cynanchi]
MPRRTLATLAAVAALAATAGTSTAPSQASTSALRYVALGDSYSAASGVLPPDPSSPSCARSTANYPHLIAARTGAAFTDVTCGAAQTKDFFTGQYPGVAPQLDAVHRRTQLVTMTIGGNDNNTFVGAIAECGAAGLSTLGQGSPCQDTYGSSFVRDIRQKTYPALVKTLRAVRHKAPHATVAILGYPWILPKTVGCFDKMPVASGDVPYLRHVEATLNNAVRRAAAATGSTYVNLSRVSEGHDACQKMGVRWVEPVLQGTNPVVVHPNALGEKHLAKRAMKVLHLR